MGQKGGEKWTAAVDLQPTISKSDRLLGTSIEFNYVATPGITDLANLTGSFIPFHKTRTARLAAGDARPSLEELYGTQEGYVTAVTAAANALVAQRLLLQRDADLQIARAKATVVLP